MADGIYVGMAAAAARAQQLESIADNLANAETPGFKAARPAFQSFMPPGGGPVDKVFAAAVATGTDTRPGLTQPTDNPMDVVPDEDAYLAVQMPNGQNAYTRNGKIEIGAEGQLYAGGRPLLGRSGFPITIPEGASPIIEENGDVMVDGGAIDTLALFRIQGAVDRLGQSFLAPAAGSTVQAIDGSVRVGELELGNATALEATVAMIHAQRQFDTAMQAIQTYRKIDERAIEVGRVR